MAKRKPKRKPRNNDWLKLKSFLWEEQRERGVYKYSSKNFNTLVSDVYATLGKKFPKNTSLIGGYAEKSEYDLFTAKSPEPEQIEYYNIDRALSAYQNNDFYQAFNIVTNFQGQFPDVKIPLADYEYQGSEFQGIIEAADKMRRERGMSHTPEKKIMIEVSHKDQSIKIYVAGSPPAAGDKNKKPAYKNIAKTPAEIEKQSKKKEKLASEQDKIENRIESLEEQLGKLSSLSTDQYLKFAEPLINQLKELQTKKSQLKNESKSVEKYLSDIEGFGKAPKAKKTNKKRAKAKPKGTGGKRKRK